MAMEMTMAMAAAQRVGIVKIAFVTVPAAGQ